MGDARYSVFLPELVVYVMMFVILDRIHQQDAAMLTDREQRIVNWLRMRKIATMRHLQHQFQVCHMTVFRALNKYGYHTSYNHNAGYYTLAGVPQFDDWGLWAYRDVRFSRRVMMVGS